jgi:hypothetical protein
MAPLGTVDLTAQKLFTTVKYYVSGDIHRSQG